MVPEGPLADVDRADGVITVGATPSATPAVDDDAPSPTPPASPTEDLCLPDIPATCTTLSRRHPHSSLTLSTYFLLPRYLLALIYLLFSGLVRGF